ncbi:MAG TPA: hypothetical protein VFO19_04440 [Vicinamibacterales bacterium]|nr:hypothetical protein [Vicinamibacterales bacterium]
MRLRSIAAVLIAVALATATAADVAGRQTATFDAKIFAALKWRNIGPYRGGRTKAATGVRSQPNVFYIGVVNGGVWKSDDYGRTWTPIFDDQPTGSIGAIAVAPSDTNILYVGSGEGMQRPDLSTGDGVYKSTDAGRTWTHLGLRDGHQITQIDVDPRDPNCLLVAVLGHPYGPNEERGVFRSIDGGKTFQKVLYRDVNTGAADLARDPRNPDVLYAVLWEARLGPWENSSWTGPGSGLFKSTDGGATWRPLTKGLPTFAEGLGRIGITVAPSNPNRLYATVDAGTLAGIYRSDDAGESWKRINDDPRLVARPADAAEVRVHPTNPDIVFVPTIAAWKSTDGGVTFTGWRGAPGGDDYQRLWINPDHPDVMLMTADQGAIVTVNGGATWSSWYNQPTAQFYHVNTDNAFPYRVCGGQQESGSACVRSRSDDGRITYRDWSPVGVEEYGFVVPDPMDPDIVYGGKVTKFDRRTGQVQDVSPPRDGDYRTLRTAPLVFSPTDRRTLFFASNTLWKTSNGGLNWTQISPDLTRDTWMVPDTVGVYRDRPSAQPRRRGVIYTIAPSTIDPNVIWVGSDDGLIHVTRDGGKTWTNVTPPALQPWAKVSVMEVSHFDTYSAYAAINAIRLDDTRPHILRTRDGGKTWVEIVTGVPADAPINVIREDPQRRGLLFAGSERAVSISFDDGERWQSLRLNMPATSIRDLTIKDADLIAGTHGRGFWILDDISPLRQITADIARAPAYLMRPATSYRFQNKYPDTPLPPDEPGAPNPPDGAMITYLLGTDAKGPVSLEIVDPNSGEVVRRYSSDDPEDAPVAGRNHPDYWLRPPARLGTTAGMHRFVWDLRYPPPAAAEFTYPISATPYDTPKTPRGIWTLPGTFQVRLTVDGRTYRQALTIRMDPRVRTTVADLTAQFTLSKRIDAAIRRLAEAVDSARRGLGSAGNDRAATERRIAALDRSRAALVTLLEAVQQVDAKPTPTQEEAAKAAIAEADSLMSS